MSKTSALKKPAARKTAAKPVKKTKRVAAATSLTIQIDHALAGWKKAFPKINDKIEQAAALAFLRAKKPAAFKNRAFELSLILTSDSVVKKLNHDYRGKNKPTNVLSFPQLNIRQFRRHDLAGFPAGEAVPLGDVVLAYQTMQREAKEQKKSLEAHTIHLIVHGILHLFGYDHMTAGDAKAMESLECDILETLGYADPYHETDDTKN